WRSSCAPAATTCTTRRRANPVRDGHLARPSPSSTPNGAARTVVSASSRTSSRSTTGRARPTD
ncbi:MAG: hypothetical protein AVDCRST_MAG47-2494, partial [uncultured Nocardioidaceae bacterium]